MALPQVGPIAAGRIGLVPGDRVRPSAGAAGATDPDLPQHRNELRAVGSLSSGQDEGQRGGHLQVGGEVNLAGSTAPRPAEQGGLQPELSAAPDASSFLPPGVDIGVLPVLFFTTAPLTQPSPHRQSVTFGSVGAARRLRA